MKRLLANYAGRPTPLYFAKRLSETLGGARIYLKREDLLHTGAHKINNCLGQVLLARRMGKKRIIAETGAGQHGVATATVCALFGIECVVYMGEEDMRRQRLNVFRMRLLGAKVVGVTNGSRTLKDAISEAMRDWVTNVPTTLLPARLGARRASVSDDGARFPSRDRRRGAARRFSKRTDVCPMRCLPASAGLATRSASSMPFMDDRGVRLIGVEAGGRGCDWASMRRDSPAASPGVLHGAFSYLLQDDDGQVSLTHSVSAGLDYASVGPEHAWLHDQGRAEYLRRRTPRRWKRPDAVAQTEGIIPALESAHAVAEAIRRAPAAEGRGLHREPLRPRRQRHRYLSREIKELDIRNDAH